MTVSVSASFRVQTSCVHMGVSVCSVCMLWKVAVDTDFDIFQQDGQLHISTMEALSCLVNP